MKGTELMTKNCSLISIGPILDDRLKEKILKPWKGAHSSHSVCVCVCLSVCVSVCLCTGYRLGWAVGSISKSTHRRKMLIYLKQILQQNFFLLNITHFWAFEFVILLKNSPQKNREKTFFFQCSMFFSHCIINFWYVDNNYDSKQMNENKNEKNKKFKLSN